MSESKPMRDLLRIRMRRSASFRAWKPCWSEAWRRILYRTRDRINRRIVNNVHHAIGQKIRNSDW